MIGIVMGSDSDLPKLRQAAETLGELGLPWEIRILSAHRTPAAAMAYAAGARERGLKAIIAGAGAAAHLAGVVAAHTSLPVIGVPLSGSALGGVDALHSTVMMPPGIPVACMAVDGARNAALFAAAVLAVADAGVHERLEAWRRAQTEAALSKDQRLQELGIDAYLQQKR